MILMPTPVQPSFSLCKWARNFSYPSAQLQKFCACVQLKLLLPPCVQLYDHTVRMELTGEQLKIAETLLKSYLPRSRQVYGYLVLRNRVNSDPVKVLVDRWPEFCVIVCKPQYEQEGDLFKDTLVFAKDEGVLEEMIRKTSVFDWTQYLCVDLRKIVPPFYVNLIHKRNAVSTKIGTNLWNMEKFKAVASEIDVSSTKLSVCHMMILEDVNNLPSIDSSGITLSSLDESHIPLVNQTWKFSTKGEAVRMIRNMIVNFPSFCVLDEQGQPVSWILTYASCAMGMLYTLPEHRGKGYAKMVSIAMARRLYAQGYPVYCFIEEENSGSYRLFQNLGFSEDPSYRETWFGFNHLK